jgi:hypothetical protein
MHEYQVRRSPTLVFPSCRLTCLSALTYLNVPSRGVTKSQAAAAAFEIGHRRCIRVYTASRSEGSCATSVVLVLLRKSIGAGDDEDKSILRPTARLVSKESSSTLGFMVDMVMVLMRLVDCSWRDFPAGDGAHGHKPITVLR